MCCWLLPAEGGCHRVAARPGIGTGTGAEPRGGLTCLCHGVYGSHEACTTTISPRRPQQPGRLPVRSAAKGCEHAALLFRRVTQPRASAGTELKITMWRMKIKALATLPITPPRRKPLPKCIWRPAQSLSCACLHQETKSVRLVSLKHKQRVFSHTGLLLQALIINVIC